MRRHGAKRHSRLNSLEFLQFARNSPKCSDKVTCVTDRNARRKHIDATKDGGKIKTVMSYDMTKLSTKTLITVIGSGLLVWIFAVVSLFLY